MKITPPKKISRSEHKDDEDIYDDESHEYDETAQEELEEEFPEDE